MYAHDREPGLKFSASALSSGSQLELGKLSRIYRLTAAQTLYRGDVLNAEFKGMPAKIDSHVRTAAVARVCASFIRRDAKSQGVESRFSRVIDTLSAFDIPSTKAEMKSLVESGDDVIIDLFVKWHTGCLAFSPFTSTTLSPKVAQMHASKWDRSTIYEIRISSERAIVDAKNEGGCGAGLEVLVFDGIQPSEIVRVKCPNMPENSELLDGHWLKDPWDFDLSDFTIQSGSHWRCLPERDLPLCRRQGSAS